MMKFIGWTSVLCASMLCVANDACAVNMTAQIQRLLNEKQEKISKLEECDGKRKGFMIAGISTLGLTAVGVGVNIAQASKSNKLSNQIEEQNLELEKQQNKIADLNAQISQKKNDTKRQDCESDGTHIWVNGVCISRAQYNCEQAGKIWDGVNCKEREPLNPTNPVNPEPFNPEPVNPNPGDPEPVNPEPFNPEPVNPNPGDPDPVKPEPSSLEKCLADPARKGNAEALACCYVSKSVATWNGQKCECTDNTKEFAIAANGKGGTCNAKEPVKTTCAEGTVKIIGGGDECVKRDYLKSDKCTCKDGTNNCKLVTDTKGPLVCQIAKGLGEKCRCEDCPSGMHMSAEIMRCVKDCAASEREYGGVCVKQSDYGELKYDGTYGLYCIRSYNDNPGGFQDSTPCAGICKWLGGSVINVNNGSMMHAAYSGCDCSKGTADCRKVFKGVLPQTFKWK